MYIYVYIYVFINTVVFNTQTGIIICPTYLVEKLVLQSVVKPYRYYHCKHTVYIQITALVKMLLYKRNNISACRSF